MTLGDKLKELRYRARLTQAELGARIGWPDSRIGVYERGEVHRPTRQSIEKLAKALNLSYDEFMKDVEDI
jgi:transcriptional regulator with XRE-family HTH domain